MSSLSASKLASETKAHYTMDSCAIAGLQE